MIFKKGEEIMVEVNAYKLENGIFYNEISSIVKDDVRYMLLANRDNNEDICIRKLVNEDGEQYIEMLDLDEFEQIRNEFIQKNKELLF